MSALLKPCHFCGEEYTLVCKTNYLDTHAYAITCRTRDCHGAIFSLGFGLFDTDEKAIAAWNTRAEAKP